MIEGIIKFHGFRLEKLNYEHKQIGPDERNLNISISPEFLVQLVEQEPKTSREEDENYFNILIGTRIGFDEEERVPFMTEVVLRGFYSFNSKNDNKDNFGFDDRRRFFLTNGCAVLFPYLRSVLTDVTSKSNHNPIILPTINFHQFIESQDINELILNSEQYADKD
ncbi:protein-export chaperone SecB [Paenibacillus sp. FSL H8-0317]|uniref:protein-export chaperone SecB n=1 Tax=unclassified Paenibacillus TaxID=185978 RepID=UPI0030D5507A